MVINHIPKFWLNSSTSYCLAQWCGDTAASEMPPRLARPSRAENIGCVSAVNNFKYFFLLFPLNELAFTGAVLAPWKIRPSTPLRQRQSACAKTISYEIPSHGLGRPMKQLIRHTFPSVPEQRDCNPDPWITRRLKITTVPLAVFILIV